MNAIQFTASTAWYEAMQTFPDVIKAQIYDAIFHYVATRQPLPNMMIASQCVFAFIKPILDEEMTRKDLKREVQKANGAKGGRPKKK